jgi:hypothetical protein
VVTLSEKTSPQQRPLQALRQAEVVRRFELALETANGMVGAHCIHETWMRGDMPWRIEGALAKLWARAASSIPEWLPMRYIDWLPTLYAVAERFQAHGSGRSNIYLVLLDYSGSRSEPHGVYVGMTKYTPAQRFDQHKAGIRSAGSVLKRGLEVLTGPALHLQYIKRADAQRIEVELADALSAAGLFVKGGH